jgi:hypothetical protein
VRGRPVRCMGARRGGAGRAGSHQPGQGDVLRCVLPAAADNIQIHGGIGFTWEHDAYLYFKRAKSSQLFLGDAMYNREHLAQRMGV